MRADGGSPAGSTSGSPVPQGEIDALQGLLAVEHAAAWGWGAAGARLEGPARDLARAAVTAHLARRDRLQALLRDRGTDPVPSRAAYELPVDPVDERAALRLALLLEEGSADAQARAMALLPSPTLRAAVVSALSAAAVRAARVRALLEPASPVTVAFPGERGLPTPLPEPTPTPAPTGSAGQAGPPG